ncbi:excinuclease ABC subunit A [Streptomyces sp. CB03234]|uniref:excinuclease ABC subunit UvrA n=1 Tax=Streptomyces sp. (strain CB03234) TaxID=1703937 RepID=UPI0009394EBC|nr:excinuclease ABC subunit UvrA [Streptomyces sp. CB03234]OKJ94684.1 excinuclease ABC subunit A [Streptomyces sp. CB03234]
MTVIDPLGQLATERPASGQLPEKLVVVGAREHNLRGVDVELPHRTLTVFTGVSGSGKSSLAFSTIFAEGQRRQVQSMSSYARQFLNEMAQPEVERISGMCSAVAVDQRSSGSRSPRSTVGTVTEIYDLMRVVYARIGIPHCLLCDAVLTGGGEGLRCPDGHGTAVPEMTSRGFSYNLPFGQCQGCQGLGTQAEVDLDSLVPDPERTIAGGAVEPWMHPIADQIREVVAVLVAEAGHSVDQPWRTLPEELRHTLLHGTGIQVKLRRPGKGVERVKEVEFTGVVPWLLHRYRNVVTERGASRLEGFMHPVGCAECGGARLSKAQLAVRVAGRNFAEVGAMSFAQCLEFFRGLEVADRDRAVVAQAVDETTARLGFLNEVGLGYLTLERPAASLSGGEAQRIRLAGLLGTQLFGLLYVLDEPTAGLHPKDGEHLLSSLRTLRDQGNTVIVVEHDHHLIRAADWVVELGPGAGVHGGELLFSGTVRELLDHDTSPTGGYVSGRRGIRVPDRRRTPRPGHEIVVRGAREHNLTGFDVSFPLGSFIAVTGVSGAGKSTLVDSILYRSAERALGGEAPAPGAHDAVAGLELIDRVIKVDQDPIGRSGRSTPATYTGILDNVRKLFAQTDEAKALGYKPGRFSFNSPGGRCEVCAGDGHVRVEMYFLPDVFLLCDECEGRRYDEDTLRVHYRGKNIGDVLEMPIEDAAEFFADVPAIGKPLDVLCDVGLGYLRLGQPANTLSGGEAQRIKLANELQRRAGRSTLYLLDEPTTGLHSSDIDRLLTILHQLVDKGHTVVTVTHSLDVIKTADWVIDIGPEGGSGGGRLAAAGSPETVAAGSGHTARYLRAVLQGE